MSSIVGWLVLVVVSGLLFAVVSLVDWRSALSDYVSDGDDGDADHD